MKDRTWFAALSAGGLVLLSACAPEPAPQVIYAEPVFDKLGNPSCRPGDVPIGGAYTADLPLCSVISGEPVALVTPVVTDDDGTVIVPDTPDDDPIDDDTTGGNQNRTQNEIRNENRNNQQSGSS